jgi:hypothetical protein
VVVVILMVVRVPRADRGSDNDGIFFGGHGVLYVGRNEQEAANGSFFLRMAA